LQAAGSRNVPVHTGKGNESQMEVIEIQTVECHFSVRQSDSPRPIAARTA
jgi:hypothetical protein